MSSSISPSYLESVSVESSTTTSIHLSWQVSDDISNNIQGFRVHYQKEASKYVQYGPMLSASTSGFDITNLVADTYYKVCLVLYRNDTIPMRQCVGASTTNWRLPVSISIGSSIGAVLALSMIVIMVLAVARCPFMVKFQNSKKKYVSRKYDSMSSHFTYDFSDTATHDPDEYISEDHTEHSCSPYKITNQNQQSCHQIANQNSAYQLTNQQRDCDFNCNGKLKSSMKHKCIGGVRPKVPMSRKKRAYLVRSRSQYSSTESPPTSASYRCEVCNAPHNMNHTYVAEQQCPQCVYSIQQNGGLEFADINPCNCKNCRQLRQIELNRNQSCTDSQCHHCQHDGSIVLHSENKFTFPDTSQTFSTTTDEQTVSQNKLSPIGADNSGYFSSPRPGSPVSFGSVRANNSEQAAQKKQIRSRDRYLWIFLCTKTREPCFILSDKDK